MHTLIIDTSYGSTVGFAGHDPIVETDSRTHVERLTANIARAAEIAAVEPASITRIIVGTGPAPFTGLRAGIVAARALAYATGAQLLGQNILEPQAAFMRAMHHDDPRFANMPDLESVPRHADGVHYVTLAVNDARRRQLYFMLVDDDGTPLIDMDIDYPASIVERVNTVLASLAARHAHAPLAVDVVGHGAARYADAWHALDDLGTVVDASVLDFGKAGLDVFAECALADIPAHGSPTALEPLYLRRPDVSVPRPLKPVLHEGPAAGSVSA